MIDEMHYQLLESDLLSLLFPDAETTASIRIPCIPPRLEEMARQALAKAMPNAPMALTLTYRSVRDGDAPEPGSRVVMVTEVTGDGYVYRCDGTLTDRLALLMDATVMTWAEEMEETEMARMLDEGDMTVALDGTDTEASLLSLATLPVLGELMLPEDPDEDPDGSIWHYRANAACRWLDWMNLEYQRDGYTYRLGWRRYCDVWERVHGTRYYVVRDFGDTGWGDWHRASSPERAEEIAREADASLPGNIVPVYRVRVEDPSNPNRSLPISEGGE